MTLSTQRKFTSPKADETLEQLAARALPNEPVDAAKDKIQSWNMHIFAMRRPRGLMLSSDVVFIEPPRG
jgi:hypothetical protein